MGKVEVFSILVTAILGLLYAFFFVAKDPVLLIIFGLQAFRSGSVLRALTRDGGK